MRGAGVVGQQPKRTRRVLRYTSGSQFKTPVGTMRAVSSSWRTMASSLTRQSRSSSCQRSGCCTDQVFGVVSEVGFLPASAAFLASCSASLRCRESLLRTTHQMSATNMPPIPAFPPENPESAFDHAEISRFPALPSCAAIVGTLWLAGCTTPPPAPVPASVPVPVAATPAPTSHPLLLQWPAVAPPAPVAGTKARWTPALFADLPGWKADDLRDVRIAFSENCKRSAQQAGVDQRLLAFPLTEQFAEAAQIHRERIRPLPIDACRRRGSWPDHRLLRTVAERVAHQDRALWRAAVFAPDDLLVVELGDLYPELRGKRVRGRLVDTPGQTRGALL